MNPQTLRSLSTPFTKGGITLHMLKYTPIRRDTLINDLARIRPQLDWKHKKTGEVVMTIPMDVVVAKEMKARAGKELIPHDWIERHLWGGAESAYITLESHCVAVDFGDTLTPAEEAFQMYWNARQGSIAEDWETFLYLYTYELSDMALEAYVATRPKTHAAPEQPPPEASDPEA